MKSVLISIRPIWCEKIANGEKTIEVRKSAPKELPFKCYIYCTKDRKNLLPIEHGMVLQNVNFWENIDAYYGFGKIIGEFICDKVEKYFPLTFKGQDFYQNFGFREEAFACLTNDELLDYGKGKTLYGWHISDLKIYDKPKELSEFFKPCPTKEKGDCLSCDCLADNDYGGICTNNLTRPPQSYMFVEELK